MPSCCEVRPSVLQQRSQAPTTTDMFPGSQADPLDRRIDGIDRKLRECHNYFINVFKADNESLGSPTCDVIASSILGRSDADSTDYDALIEKLEGEELSQVSNFKCRSINVRLR